MRNYKTISQQNTYDLAAQKFGSLDGIYGVLKALPNTTNVNDVIPFALDLELEDTENNLGLLFDANNSYFSTGNIDLASSIGIGTAIIESTFIIG